MAAPRLERTSGEEAAARAARDKETLKEAKRAALEEKRAERAARKAEREAERVAARDKDRRRDPRDEERDDLDDLEGVEAVEEGAEQETVEAADGPGADAEKPAAIVVVHEPTPGGRSEEPRR